ncbi:hypothetical protein TNCV_4750421 [Trichonephila clavipes]|nr:hypothetical protein TNCV_4750421 [Trichonephila clavipes]
MVTHHLSPLISCPSAAIRGSMYGRILGVISSQTRYRHSFVKSCGSPVVRVSDLDSHAMSSSPVPVKTCRVGQLCTLNLSRAETSSVVW